MQSVIGPIFGILAFLLAGNAFIPVYKAVKKGAITAVYRGIHTPLAGFTQELTGWEHPNAPLFKGRK